MAKKISLDKLCLEIILVDMDGTLCKEVCWDNKQVLRATPIKENIAKSNRMYDHNFIVIYTARRDYLIESTIDWLRKNNVKYHAISNQKIPGKYYIDDDSKKFEDFR